jgi:hypothetical protein
VNRGVKYFLAFGDKFEPMTPLARYLAGTREVEQMYIGGGLVGVVLVVLVVLFLVGRI